MTHKIVRSVPFNNEPYYPPGYMGYTPQVPFRFGNTFGRTTHETLLDQTIAKSENSVLNPIVPVRDAYKNDRANDPNTREWMKETWGDKKYVDPMMPGFSSYIPRSQEYYGSRYAKICEQSRKDFLEVSKAKELKCAPVSIFG